MSSRSSTQMPAFTAVVQGAVAVGGLVASAFASEVLAGYVAICGSVAVVIACRALPGVGRAVRPLLVVLVAAFPLAAVLWGETGLLWATAASTIASMGSFVFEGLRPGAMRSLAVAMLLLLYYGFLSSFLVLIRFSLGHRPLVALTLLVVAYEMGNAVAVTRKRGASASEGRQAGWLPPAAGLVACLAASLASGAFLNNPTRPVSLLFLGTVVGAVAVLSHAIATRVSEEHTVATDAISVDSAARLTSLLLAAPAFLYAFRLFLT
jgi:hypothetical protein